MIQPAAVKYTCACGFSRIYQPQSDAINPLHAQYACTCPKCGETMSGEALPFMKRYRFTFSDSMPDTETLKKNIGKLLSQIGTTKQIEAIKSPAKTQKNAPRIDERIEAISCICRAR